MPTRSADNGGSAHSVLAELNAAGTPWLAIAPTQAGLGVAGPGDAAVAVIDPADPRAVPVTMNPFQPEPGYPVQDHADRLAGLFVAVFEPPIPVRTVITVALRRVYAACGWDTVTGAGMPGGAPPCVPAFRQVRLAALATASDLGYDAAMLAAVRGFFDGTLDPLWGGSANRFLAGGHPVEMASLLTGGVLIAVGDGINEPAAGFRAGVVLLRLAEHLRIRGGRLPDPAVPGGGCVLVLSARHRMTGWVGDVLADIRACGMLVMTPACESRRRAVLRRSPAGGRVPRRTRRDGSGDGRAQIGGVRQAVPGRAWPAPGTRYVQPRCSQPTMPRHGCGCGQTRSSSPC